MEYLRLASLLKSTTLTSDFTNLNTLAYVASIAYQKEFGDDEDNKSFDLSFKSNMN